MSNTDPRRHEPTISSVEPYRGAYVKHSSKKNEIPIVSTSRKIRATKGFLEQGKSLETVDIAGEGQMTAAATQAIQGGGTRRGDGVDTVEGETLHRVQDSAGLVEGFSSSLVFADPDDPMGGYVSEVTDEEFISADEGYEETIVPRQLGSYCPISYVSTTSIPIEIDGERQQSTIASANPVRNVPMPSHSLDFGLPRHRLPMPHAPVVFTPPGSADRKNKPREIRGYNHLETSINGQKDEPEAYNSRCLVRVENCNNVVMPMEDIDCAVVNEGAGKERMDDDGDDGHGYETEVNAADNQGPELARARYTSSADCHHPNRTLKQMRKEQHGRQSHRYDADDEIEDKEDNESELDEEESEGNSGLNRGLRGTMSGHDDNHIGAWKPVSQQRTYTPKPFSEAENNFKLSLRLHISEKFGHQKPYPIQTPSRQQLDAFTKSGKAIDGPNLQTFLLDFEGPTVFTPWNERLALLLANEFLNEPNSFTNNTVEVQKAFMVCFRTMHRRYQERHTVLADHDVIDKQQKHRQTNQSARQGYLRNRREAAAKYFRTQDRQMEAFSKLWEQMPKEACSEDEEVIYPNGNKMYEILTPGWRNVAVKVWFRTWDHLAISMRYGPDGKPGPGKFPRVRIEARQPRRDPHATAPRNLPRNFYDNDWYQALDCIEKQKLNAGPPINLTLPTTIIRTAERYEHIKHRKDKPLDPNDPTLTQI